MNLLKETMEAIRKSGHKIKDIIFIGSEMSGHYCSWEEFTKLADKNYDNGYGGQKVASDLIIVFRDGMKMWRGEYDGAEWWEYAKPFIMPKRKKKIENLFATIGWNTLESIDRKEK